MTQIKISFVSSAYLIRISLNEIHLQIFTFLVLGRNIGYDMIYYRKACGKANPTSREALWIARRTFPSQ